MDSHLKILIAIEILNLAVSLICFIFAKIRKNTEAPYILIVMILCPVMGPLFYLLSLMLRKAFFSEPVDLAGVVFGKDKVKGAAHAQEDRESNLVSMEEAIAITNSKDLRTLMMNVVQGDVKKSLHSISLALNSEDSETSHYAASVLQDELNEFRITVENYRKKIEDESETGSAHGEELINNLTCVIEYMNPFLEQRVFSDIEQVSYVHTMAEFCEKLYALGAELLSSVFYEAVCMRLLEIDEYEECEKWCERGREQYPNTLSSFTCELKLYFNWGNREKFFAAAEALKKSSVVLDRETLELIRAFG